MNKFLFAPLRFSIRTMLGIRRATFKGIKELAKKTKNKKILEIGSGKPVKKKYPYSYEYLFKKHNDFTRSDVNSHYGHKIIDITKMNLNQKYDLIICLNVLEHVYDFKKAIKNMHKALKKKGEIAVFIPFIYPLHDEPIDFFRYSEHALKRMFNKFKNVKIRHFGIRQFPTAYFLTAKK